MDKSSQLKRIQHDWRSPPWVGALVLFLIAAGLFTWWSWSPTFRDPDSFYHLRLAELLMKNRMATVDFLWLPFTTLADAYVDHHFLYHLFLVPFIYVFGSFLGMKIATVLLAAMTIGLFYLILRSAGVRYPSIYALFLLTNADFAFRMSLSKAPSVAFLLLFFGFWCLLQKKWKPLFIAGFLFVWAYGGFLLLLVTAIIHLLVTITLRLVAPPPKPKKIAKTILHESRFVLATGAGILAGLLLHPSFPQHFAFYWEQIIQIGLINYQEIIGVGGEWYPKSFQDITVGPLLVSGLLLIAIGFASRRLQQLKAIDWTALIMTVIFFLFTLKSQRYIEYYVPWAVLTAALLLHQAGIEEYFKKAKHTATLAWNKSELHKSLLVLSAVTVIVMTGGLMLRSVQETHISSQNGIPYERFAQAGQWLREHSTKGDLVFHSDWDEFPILFYNVTRDQFIAGLDPTFFYKKNEDLYWKWVNITTGKTEENILEIIQKDFDARFVFIENGHNEMQRNIILDGRFKEVYHDEEATIYRVPRKKVEPQTSEALLLLE